MLEQGLLDEVQGLRERGDLSLDSPSMRAVGYRQAWQYIEGELSLDELFERGVIATRQLAKRQFTWLRGWQQLQWIHTDEQGLLVSSEETGAAIKGLQGAPAIRLALKYLARLTI
jgi:tRNA dimethylallyltransferase